MPFFMNTYVIIHLLLLQSGGMTMGIFTMKNSKLTVAIADAGAELISIFDNSNQRELLWQADPKFWNRHAPVLFPNVGKYYGGCFLYEGKEYPEGQHGFARDMEFDQIEGNDTMVKHRLVSNDETRQRYPFDFQFDVTHHLNGNRLTVQWDVVNQGDKTMYFTIGGHPAFRVEILPNTQFEDYFLQFASDVDELSYLLLDLASGTAMPDKALPLHLHNHQLRLKKDMFDKDALIFDGGQIQWVALSLPDGSPYIALESKDFPNFGIWSKPGAPYVCLEPWCGRCDNQGFDKDISEKPGIIALASGETFEKAYDIIVYES